MKKTQRNCKNHTKNAKNDISGITDVLPGFLPYWLSPITSFHHIGDSRYYRDILESVTSLSARAGPTAGAGPWAGPRRRTLSQRARRRWRPGWCDWEGARRRGRCGRVVSMWLRLKPLMTVARRHVCVCVCFVCVRVYVKEKKIRIRGAKMSMTKEFRKIEPLGFFLSWRKLSKRTMQSETSHFPSLNVLKNLLHNKLVCTVFSPEPW
jgi:hypothetical protein